MLGIEIDILIILQKDITILYYSFVHLNFSKHIRVNVYINKIHLIGGFFVYIYYICKLIMDKIDEKSLLII
jgi:hypothetical protein